jgi:maleate cis-trans isomerase
MVVTCQPIRPAAVIEGTKERVRDQSSFPSRDSMVVVRRCRRLLDTREEVARMQNSITDGVAGWRGILGWVCPAVASSYTVMDFHSVAPEGMELKIVTLGITAHVEAEVEMALSKLDDAVIRLATVGSEFIIVEGTPLVSYKGFGFDQEVIKRVQDKAKVPAITSLTAAANALRALNLKKLVMASPMNEESDIRTKKYLEDSGFEIIHLKSLNKVYNRDIDVLPRSTAYSLARQAYREAPKADGIYMPCGAWCPPWVIDCLERDLGVPVVHSRQATTWAGFKALGVKEPLRGWGKLFETLRAGS